MKKLRTLAIVDYVRQRKYCSTNELQKAFEVSPATIQRDIAEIVRSNQLRKVHGGVAILDTPQTPPAPANDAWFGERVMINPEQKRTIAGLAMSLIHDGDVLFFDSSTTALFLARELRNAAFSNLTIITNSLSVMEEFRSFRSSFVQISLGGTFDAHLNAFLGKATQEALRRYHIDKAFVSAAGITNRGLFTHHEALGEFLHLVMQSAKATHVLVDSSKFNKNAVFGICPLTDIRSLITDLPPPAAIAPQVAHVIHPGSPSSEVGTTSLVSASSPA